MVRPDVELLEIRVVPRASRNEVCEERAGRLIVRTTAAPVDDAANQAVRKLVARHLGVPVRDVEIVRGHNRRDKTLAVDRRTQPRES